MKRYVLHPGYIKSRSDGDWHYIDAYRLAKLYGVPLHECIVVDANRPETFRSRDLSGFKHLYPREDGKYRSYKGDLNE